MHGKVLAYNATASDSKQKHGLIGLIAAAFVLVIAMTVTVSAVQAAIKIPNAIFTANSKTYNLDQFRGRKIMLWLFSTWCPSCQVGLKVLSDNQPELKKLGLTVIALVNYKNGGYPGPTAQAFAKKYAKEVTRAPNWLFGNASKKLASIYNPKGYPDIYFLIDKNGFLKIVSDAPSATIDKIINFAKSKDLSR